MSNFEAASNSGYFADNGYSLNNLTTDFGGLEQAFTDKLIGKLTMIRKKYGNFVFIKPDLTKEEIRNWYSNEFRSRRKCSFIWHSAFIRSDGVIVPCQFLLKYELGNNKIDVIFRSALDARVAGKLKKTNIA